MMAIIRDPEVNQPHAPPLKTSPERSGGWFRRLQRRIGLALAGDDEELILENKTAISWHVYHNYHWLGFIDAGESQAIRLDKRGSLSVRPSDEGDEVEYLVLPLDLRVHHVRIYRRHLAKEVEVYDLQVA
jgi:hypothetical protein